MSYKSDKEYLIYCEKCRGETEHHYLIDHSEEGIHSKDQVSWQNRHELLRCCGCKSKTFRTVFYFSEHCDEHGTYTPEIYNYPVFDAEEFNRWMDTSIHGVTGEALSRMFGEVKIAMSSNCVALAATGMRAILEYAFKGKDIKSNKEMIQNAHKEGFISENEQDELLAINDQAGQSIHQMHFPEKSVLEKALSTLENLVERIYTNADLAQQIRSGFPKSQKG